jgi:Tol biopolymer transport system component
MILRICAASLLVACLPHDTRPVVSDAEIVVMVDNDGRPPGSGTSSDLVTMNLDGSHRTQITHDDQLEFLPHFSLDGTRLLYTKYLTGTYGQPSAATDIAIYDFTTETESLLTHRGDAAQAAWSPDGSTITFLTHGGSDSSIWLMDADGGSPRLIGSALRTADDAVWGDIAWSSDDWILFVVAEQPSGPCFKVRLDKVRPDGSERTKVSDGGTSCTPTGMEQSGDADPGFSADGQTIYTSRGLPRSPAGASPPVTERKLVSLSSAAWSPGKLEADLSLASEPDCVEGVPKGSPDGTQILDYRLCFDASVPAGTYVTDTAGSYRTFVAEGFGADWNPVAR